MTDERKAAYELLQAKVESLKAELPGISFGYIGNYERWGDDTQWSIFLPHAHRVGTFGDQVSIGPGRDDETFINAVSNWENIEARVRKLYAADANRLETLILRDGRLYHENGAISKFSVRNNQFFLSESFSSVAEANARMRSWNYPTVVR